PTASRWAQRISQRVTGESARAGGTLNGAICATVQPTKNAKAMVRPRVVLVMTATLTKPTELLQAARLAHVPGEGFGVAACLGSCHARAPRCAADSGRFVPILPRTTGST